MLDSGASKTIINTKYGMVLTWSSDKVVVTANGSELPASNTALLPLRVLSKGAREAIVVPGMTQKALLSVGTLADNNYTTVFLLGRQGVDIYRANDVNISAAQSPILRGWQDCRGLWMVPLDEKKTKCQPGTRPHRKCNEHLRVAKHERSSEIFATLLNVASRDTFLNQTRPKRGT